MSFNMFCIRTGYVYWARMENTGPIKIGFSSNPHRRIYTLNTSSPYPINLIYFTPACQEDEKNLHYEHRNYLIRNEWFHPYEGIFKEIEWKKRIDRKNGTFLYENYDPVKDLGDWTLASDRWNEPHVLEVSNKINDERMSA